VVDWPPKGADLSPIENFWAEVNREVNALQCTSPDELWEALSETWELYREKPNYFENLYDSIPNRIDEIIEKEGNWSKY